MKNAKNIFFILFFVFLIAGCDKQNELKQNNAARGNDSLFILSGAGLKVALDPLGKAFTEETGIPVEYSYLCSAMLLTNLELTQKGDIFVAGSSYYFKIALQKGLVDTENVAVGGYMIPAIMVRKGNPEKITCLKDLLKPGLKLGVGDFKALAVGRLTEKMLERNGIYDEFMKNVVVTSGTATKLCLPVCMNSLDAVINFIPTARNFDHCSDIVLIDKKQVLYSTFPVALTKYSKNRDLAKKYFDFLLSPRGQKIFKEYGFGPYFDPKPDQYLE